MNLSKRFSTRIALGLIKRATGIRGFGVISSEQTHASETVDRANSPIAVTALEAVNASSVDGAGDPTPYADNDEPYRIRFRKMGITKAKRLYRRVVQFLAACLAFVLDLASPKLSRDEKFIMLSRLRRWNPDDLETHRRAKEDAAIFQFHKQQAKLVGARIIEKLTQLRFCYFVTKNEQVHVKKRITFSDAEVSQYAYVYKIGALPFGVRMTEIAKEEVTNELSATVNKKVRIELSQWGLKITVEVASTLSIPNYVGFKDLIDRFPKTAAPLTFILGVTTNGAPMYRNLADAPHMIIAGSTGGGKSNEENVIINSLIHRNDPRVLKCVFFDMKGGVEFNFYEGVPHLLSMSMPAKTDKDGEVKRREWTSNGIIERKHDVIPALEWLLNECEARLKKIRAAKVKNLHEFNRGKRPDKRIPYIVIFFDEWAVISKSEFGREAMTLLGELGNISRSTGFNIVLCTQYPNADILVPTISVNFDWRIAFSMTTGASQSVLGGSWDAYGLSPVGRAIFHSNEGNIQVQTPRITNGNIEAIVEGIKSGSNNIAGMMGVDLSELFEWSLNFDGGKLRFEALFNQFREKISKDNLLSLLRSTDGKVFDVQGTLYRVVNTPGGNRSRHLELAEDQAPQPGEAEFRKPNAPDSATIMRLCEQCGGSTDQVLCEYCGAPETTKGE